MIHTIKIGFPRWKDRSIGIAEYKLVPGNNFIEILYTNKSGPNKGQRLYPHIYCMTGLKIAKYPVDYQRKIKLFIIPIENLSILNNKENL